MSVGRCFLLALSAATVGSAQLLGAIVVEGAQKLRLVAGSVRVSDGVALATLSDESPATLTLSPQLQEASDKLLSLARPLYGTALLIDVRSGQVRAYSEYTRPGSPTVGELMMRDVPAASLFKIVTTTALLERTPVDPKTRVCIDGGEHEIERKHLERPAPEHAQCGRFAGALGFSRNAAFAQLATRYLIRTDLLDVAERLGFNQPLLFDLPATVGRVDLPFNDLEFAQAAAGFRWSSLTPIGAAHITYAVALGGMAGRIRLIKAHGDWIAPKERELTHRLMAANTAWRLTRMMEVTVHSGTSLEAFTSPSGQSYLGAIRIAGKTGTLSRNKTSTYSWFTGFAPSRDPKVVVTVMLENSAVWRQKANEVARDLLRVYFQGSRGVSNPFDSEG